MPRSVKKGPFVEHYLAKKQHDPDLPMELLINDSMGWTPIMIKTIINEALIKAHEEHREFLNYKDWLDAADERTMGLKQPIRSWNLTDRRETAYHEAGHAVAARYLRPSYRISKATIIRSSRPGRTRAGSRTSGRFVAPMTKTSGLSSTGPRTMPNQRRIL